MEKKKDPNDKLKLEIASELGLREKSHEVWMEEPLSQRNGKDRRFGIKKEKDA